MDLPSMRSAVMGRGLFNWREQEPGVAEMASRPAQIMCNLIAGSEQSFNLAFSI